jgi:hypothetical protein
MGVPFDDPMLEPLFAAAKDANEIVSVAAARALRQLHFEVPHQFRLRSAVQADLWNPPAEEARSIANSEPKRGSLLESLQLSADDAVGFALAEAVRMTSDPSGNRTGMSMEAGKKAATMGSTWQPNIKDLFGLYLSVFEESTEERLDWLSGQRDSAVGEGMPMPTVVPIYYGALTTSWQIAFAASRAPLSEIVREIGPALAADKDKVRWAAAQFLEETALYANQKIAPEFAGGTGPSPDTEAEVIFRAPEMPEEWASTEATAEEEVLDTSAAAETGEPPPRREPTPRYADITLFRDEQRSHPVPSRSTLKAGTEYWLESAVREVKKGIDAKRKSLPVRPVKQQTDIALLVTADSDEFEIEPQLGYVTLPPTGDSTHQAVFKVTPKRGSTKGLTGKIELRFYYRFNLIEHVVFTARTTLKEQRRKGSSLLVRQRSVSREMLDFDEFVPRRMNIHVSKDGTTYRLKFTLAAGSGEEVVLRARTIMSKEDMEDALERVREILEDLALRDYANSLQPGRGTFREAVTRLAAFGSELWTSLFRGEPGSDLDAIGLALRDRPIESDGFIQVSMPERGTYFILPWALLYDKPLPADSYTVPDPRGFWGYRYAIEQRLASTGSSTDAPVQMSAPMKLAFMVWDSFPNAADQVAMMDQLTRDADPKLEVSSPPVALKDDFYKRVPGSADSILYFYTHGHTRKRLERSKAPNLAKLLEAQLKRTPEDAPERNSLLGLLKRLVEDTAEHDKTYIELSSGRLYYTDLLSRIERLSSSPFVFLNMCESAQSVPLFQENFINLFLGLGARAVLGTECTMTVNFAHPFSSYFLKELLRGSPLAIALRSTRQHFLDKQNPLGLAYTLYGSGAVRYLPPRLPLSSTTD